MVFNQEYFEGYIESQKEVEVFIVGNVFSGVICDVDEEKVYIKKDQIQNNQKTGNYFETEVALESIVAVSSLALQYQPPRKTNKEKAIEKRKRKNGGKK